MRRGRMTVRPWSRQNARRGLGSYSSGRRARESRCSPRRWRRRPTRPSSGSPPRTSSASGRASPSRWSARSTRCQRRRVKVTGLAQKLGQLEAVSRDLQLKSWANLKLLGQPCNFHTRRRGRSTHRGRARSPPRRGPRRASARRRHSRTRWRM